VLTDRIVLQEWAHVRGRVTEAGDAVGRRPDGELVGETVGGDGEEGAAYVGQRYTFATDAGGGVELGRVAPGRLVVARVGDGGKRLPLARLEVKAGESYTVIWGN
jgi:hypothetical protein